MHKGRSSGRGSGHSLSGGGRAGNAKGGYAGEGAGKKHTGVRTKSAKSSAKPAAKAGGKYAGKGRASSRPAVQVVNRARSDGRYWMYGWHAVEAALHNPAREITRLWVSDAARQKLDANAALLEAVHRRTLLPEQATPEMFARVAGADAPHQGIAVEASPLPDAGLEAVYASAAQGPILLLDQVTDPHNVGAILRSALAFNAKGIIMPDRNSAPESGALAKAAAGALETLPITRVTNLSQAILGIKASGYWVLGLDGEASTVLPELNMPEKLALVLGAEGKGLRRLTGEKCDMLTKLPMSPAMESLNVSVAAAIALYACYTR